MKNKNIGKLIAVLTALAIPLICWAATIESVSIAVPTARASGSNTTAGNTNTVATLGTVATQIDFSASPYPELALHARLWAQVTGTNAASTGGVVRSFYSFSQDGTIFTTDNADRYVELNLSGTSTVVNSVPIDLYAAKYMIDGGYAVTSTNNGFTGRAMWITYEKW